MTTMSSWVARVEWETPDPLDQDLDALDLILGAPRGTQPGDRQVGRPDVVGHRQRRDGQPGRRGDGCVGPGRQRDR